MSKLNIDQKSIMDLFSDKKSDFLIPDYQRPYAWEEKECQKLWEDVFSFAFPENDHTLFKRDDEYFLGPIVTYKNEDKNNKLEIIDGQQRLTTLMLLLRAFYSKFGNMKDQNSVRTSETISRCIWKTDEFGYPNKEQLKIDSEVSSDDDKEEFLSILRTGNVTDKQKSKYAENYRFFQDKIDNFLQEYPGYFPYLPARILNNCILLPIEAESQDTALRIFSTLNDRGLPLSDTDIFKAQFYKYYSDKGEKDDFIARWKELETICNEIFDISSGSPMDELFARYMYFERAKQGNKKTTTEALRKFYEGDSNNSYSLLKQDETLNNLEILAKFWKSIAAQDDESFSIDVLKQLSILHYAPNSMWTYLVSVYFLHNRDENNKLNNEDFLVFLKKIISFIWTYAIERPGVNALRTPVYPEMINIVNNISVKFNDYKFEENKVRNSLENYIFTNGRPITKSILAWWTYYDKPEQPLLNINTKYEIEHIYSKKRQENENSLLDKNNIESLGNKALLEKNINIRAADYRLIDKKKYYTGFTTDKGEKKLGTCNNELLILSENSDFNENNIIKRKQQIIDSFIKCLEENNLLYL